MVAGMTFASTHRVAAVPSGQAHMPLQLHNTTSRLVVNSTSAAPPLPQTLLLPLPFCQRLEISRTANMVTMMMTAVKSMLPRRARVEALALVPAAAVPGVAALEPALARAPDAPTVSCSCWTQSVSSAFWPTARARHAARSAAASTQPSWKSSCMAST